MHFLTLKLPAKYVFSRSSRLQQLGRSTPRHSLSHLIMEQSRSFTSNAGRCNNTGLAQAPLQRNMIFDGMGNTQAFPPIPVDNYPPFPAGRPRPPSVELNRGSIDPRQTSIQVETERPTSIRTTPAYYVGSKFDRVRYWQKIGRWKDVSEDEFLSYSWNTAKDIQGKMKLHSFLDEILPETIPSTGQQDPSILREDFIKDVMDGIAMAPMSIRLTPHIVSSVNWNDPLNDPLSRQFIPKKSTFQRDHPKLKLDSLHETEDSPCEGLVHRYTDKCLFLASSHCPLYCRYCTRSYAVGANTETVAKVSLKPKLSRWNAMLDYIASTPAIQDVVISGGDSYSLAPHHLRLIGERLLDIDHVRRFRIATKGICVSPSRTLDPNDDWTDELIRLSNIGRQRGKHVALHTHFNHPSEFSWVTREAAQKLFQNSVVVRNQSVLLKGVNDDAETMGQLIRELGDNNILPYYVYAGDMVKGVEDLRPPLQTILDLECQLRGSIAGFLMPQFVVDLPGGGGKRLASSHRSYDRETGVSTFVAPAVKGKGKEDKVYEYYDPLASLPNHGRHGCNVREDVDVPLAGVV